ncbi:MAG TPA: CDP-diacylglycerol--serine O-phosphatidyltransferase [Methanosarcinales archaeon]|nr:CDP-diacylglycerol--serine O-phosphatidyltransferase [Methanosarcinales archaeon]
MKESIQNKTGWDILRLIRLPDLITILNALFGFTAILYLLNDDLGGAAIMVLAAALADGVDGAIARHVESGVFGEYLDSFADAISFGVAPALIYYAMVGTYQHTVACAFSAAYLICGMLRLSRFGVLDDIEFRGLPITAAGTFAALLLYLIDYIYYSPYVVTGVLAGLSLLMVSNIQYPKVRSVRILVPLAVVFVLTIASHYGGFCDWFAWVLFSMIGCYLLSPLVWHGQNR